MQLCLMIEGQEDVTWPQWMALARACEAHGVPALFRSDHYLNLDGQHPERGALDAWGTVCGLAAITSSLRLGTLVSPATFRYPSNLAKLATTADHISGGRVEVGLGAGWHEREHAAYGFPFPATAQRLEVLEEQLQIVLGNWAEERFDFRGKKYELSDLDARPKPVQRPHPPLIMGGSAGPRSAALAAAYADEYNTPFPTLDDVRARRQRIIEACSGAGREPIPFSIMTSLIAGADEPDLHARAARLVERVGLAQGAAEFLAQPPPGWIVGTVDQVVEQLGQLREAGVSRVMCQQLLHDDLEAVRLLGDELGPRVA
ncbi:MAG: TIGR03560 family F420-dependent LLM class oxidoreductase [Solirubrobacterales bacterium]|nr:TIGR03560 family F420-dependent LLM class oxidoreductase [Solirubrobacterales bacterium]